MSKNLSEQFEQSLPLYKSHKTVRAVPIEGFDYSSNSKVKIHLKGQPAVLLPSETVQRYKPVSGDYLVIYEDGYESFSPRKAFEDGYIDTRELAGDIEPGDVVQLMSGGALMTVEAVNLDEIDVIWFDADQGVGRAQCIGRAALKKRRNEV